MITEQARKASACPTRAARWSPTCSAGSAGGEGRHRSACDVIRAFDGAPINQSGELPPLVGAMAPGTQGRSSSILRDGKPRDLTVTLTQLDERRRGRRSDCPSGRAPSASLVAIRSAWSARTWMPTTAASARPQAGRGRRHRRASKALAAREAGLQPGDVILRSAAHGRQRRRARPRTARRQGRADRDAAACAAAVARQFVAVTRVPAARVRPDSRRIAPVQLRPARSAVR